MSGKHTPTPWHVDPKRSLRIATADDVTVASTSGDDRERDRWEANAAHIVRCVNLHDELVAACEAALAYFDDVDGCGSHSVPWPREKVTTALARARGGA